MDVASANAALSEAPPQGIVEFALEQFGDDLVIAFSGSDDVALIDLASRTGRRYRVLSVDTGRLHPETYEFIDRVRQHYSVAIEVVSPEAGPLEALVRQKGLFSFYEDGHTECCGIRKVAPLKRALSTARSWVTGQRRDQNQETRGALPVVEVDPVFVGADGPLIKWNPLARWTHDDLWAYLRDQRVPQNRLHARGFRSIGCAPCTRALAPGQSEREGRWWWEDASKKECGIHAGNLPSREVPDRGLPDRE